MVSDPLEFKLISFAARKIGPPNFSKKNHRKKLAYFYYSPSYSASNSLGAPDLTPQKKLGRFPNGFFISSHTKIPVISPVP
jgi:hypothetical protein